ncbi:MAG: crotonase/enoyl-CoA hydratase family protein [Burkholderiales bacterium]
MENFLLYEKDGAIVTLTMNRPEERNPLTGHFDEFVNACTRINADQSVKCVILTGAGPAFCAGGNVKDMRDKKGIASGSSREIMDGYRNGIQRIPLAFYNLEVPSIAAVNGAAIGAGNDLACMCDIRIASDTALFAESFVKLGIIPGDGGAWLLPRVVGMSKAAEMTYTGDRIDAKEALACGLVSRVVPAADLMNEARALAGRIASNPGVTLRMSKRLLREGQHTRLDSLLEMSAALQAIAHFTPEHDAAVQAFFEGRSAKK